MPLYDGPIWQLPAGITSGGEAGRAWVAPASALGMERLAAAEMVPATEMSAVVATSRKRRRKEMLQDKWYCGFCKHYSPKAETICGHCKVSRSVELSQCEAEQRRLTSREKTRKGRELNLAGANAAAAVPRQAAGVFDAAEREADVEMAARAV